MTGTCCWRGIVGLGVGLATFGDEPIVSGVRISGGCWGRLLLGDPLGKLYAVDWIDDARTCLADGRGAMGTGEFLLLLEDFMLSTFLTAIVGFVKVVILLALSIMSFVLSFFFSAG